jgi:hypothetical protein
VIVIGGSCLVIDGLVIGAFFVVIDGSFHWFVLVLDKMVLVATPCQLTYDGSWPWGSTGGGSASVGSGSIQVL